METQCPIVLDRTGKDVHAETVRLREQGPVARVELPDGVLAWSVTTYELVKQVLSDARFQKDATKHWPAYINGEIPPEWQMINWVVMENMTTRDNEDHHRLRSPIAKAFTPRNVAAARPLIEKIVNDLLAKYLKTSVLEKVSISFDPGRNRIIATGTLKIPADYLKIEDDNGIGDSDGLNEQMAIHISG